MDADAAGANQRWAVSAVCGSVVVIMLIALIRLPTVPTVAPAPTTPRRPSVALARTGGLDSALNEEAQLHDQRPLFLPTSQNPGLRFTIRSESAPSALNRDALKLAFAENELKLNRPPPIVVPPNVTEALMADAAPVPLQGFGRVDPPVETAVARGAAVEIV